MEGQFMTANGGVVYTQAQANIGQAPVKQASVLEALYRELVELRERVGSSNSRLQNMSDRALGPMPQSANEVGPSTKPTGAVREIVEQIELLKRMIGYQADIISHLETVM